MGQADGYDHAPLIARLALALIVASLGWGASVAAARTGTGDADLGNRLGAALHAKGIAPARTGAMALDLTSGRVVFAHNSAVGFVPASNEKLPVTYAALKVLGPTFRFPTEVRGQGSLGTDGTWKGNLVLKGYGDPTLSTGRLRILADRVHRLGIRRVSGMVIGDESFFDKLRTAPGWKASFYIEESPPLSALVVDRAWTGKAYTTTPAYTAADTFRKLLVKAGVAVAGKARSFQAGGKVLAVTVSKPLDEVLHAVDADSDNFSAELLLKELGAVAGDGGTSFDGAAVVRQCSRRRRPARRRHDRRRLRPVVARPAHAAGARRHPPRVLVRPPLRGRSCRPWPSPASPAPWSTGSSAGHSRDGGRQDRNDRSRLRALGFVHGRYAFAVMENGTPVPWWTARAAQDRFVQLLAAAS